MTQKVKLIYGGELKTNGKYVDVATVVVQEIGIFGCRKFPQRKYFVHLGKSDWVEWKTGIELRRGSDLWVALNSGVINFLNHQIACKKIGRKPCDKWVLRNLSLNIEKANLYQ